jgi:hypothetical protein
MTEVSITDFQGVSAEFDLGTPLCLISGSNGAGKSRIARALAAVLSDTPTPLTGKKGDLRECLTADGALRASVVLRDGDSLKAMIWTEGRCEPSVKGPQDGLPRASVYAAGLVSPVTLSGKDRAASFAEIFKTEPTEKELGAALKAPGLGEKAKALWNAIEINGWDAVAKDATDTARKLKGAWGEVTGATWGERVAEDWEPDAAHFPDPAALQSALQQAQENLEHAKRAVTTAEEARANLPERVDDVAGHTCPWCEKPVMFQFGNLVRVEQEKLTRQQIRDLRMAIAGADGKLANARDQVHHQERAVGAAEARIKDAAAARHKAKARADELHQEILEELAVARICGPQGLRQKKLEQVLDLVNRSLSALSEETGLPILEIDADLSVTLAGTAYHRLSRAESWLARTIMQIEVARRDGSPVVVVDDLDVLAAPKDRNAVISAILGAGLTAVVLQAAWDVRDAQKTPDLEATGHGKTFWIDHRHGLRPIAEARAGGDTREAA